ncbi:hypothetical protein BOX15_Mlig005878g1 [Macrostomum lignano]|uniref:F-box domain-containing protein n=1 Tax=Macrostomum lignano TaxID=282301 RepID=A0A267FAX6_9PLAT|nr:hypothetical protein BOX15_Mlig005878g1 [Macrostomum lignano]
MCSSLLWPMVVAGTISRTPIGTRPGSLPAGYCSEDFVEVEYSQPVRLQRIRVYETFVPGCLVAVFARSLAPEGADAEADLWHRVWRRPGPSKEPHASRVFEPPTDSCWPPVPPNRLVNRLRLEFNCCLAAYYTEIDTVELIGTAGIDSGDQEAAVQPLAEQVASLSLVDAAGPAGDSADPAASAGWFGRWPSELLSRLLGLLDLQSLLRLGQTCRLLNHFSADPLLYRSLSLRPYCLRLKDDHLLSLAERLTACRQLELSWCSGVGPATFCQLVNCRLDDGARVGRQLTALRLASCGFLDDTCLTAIAESCPALNELDLSGCNSARTTVLGFSALATGLRRLRRLNLYRCGIGLEQLLALIRANPDLRHVNLGACPVMTDFADGVVVELAACCRGLLSLDLWRSRGLGCLGVTALADGCPGLLELDIGWCTRVNSSTGCLAELAQKCRSLQKLFLTANRTIRDVDVEQIAKHCRDLRQLDILGSNQVSLEAVQFVLRSCPKLEMFDVSFCGQIKRASVECLKADYPHCSLQMSFQNQQ